MYFSPYNKIKHWHLFWVFRPLFFDHWNPSHIQSVIPIVICFRIHIIIGCIYAFELIFVKEKTHFSIVFPTCASRVYGATKNDRFPNNFLYDFPQQNAISLPYYVFSCIVRPNNTIYILVLYIYKLCYILHLPISWIFWYILVLFQFFNQPVS